MANGTVDIPITERRLQLWMVVIIVLATWLFTAGMTYELAYSFRDETQRRITTLEENERQYVTRPEYDHQEKFFSDWLTRVEIKLDRVLSKK